MEQMEDETEVLTWEPTLFLERMAEDWNLDHGVGLSSLNARTKSAMFEKERELRFSEYVNFDRC
jgi:hypothetical protein